LLCHERYDSIYFVVDGLDEADPDTQGEVMNMIKRARTVNQVAVKLYFLSREEAQTVNALSDYTKFCISESTIAHEIEAYVAAFVSNRTASHPVDFNTPALQIEVKNELVTKARGM